MPNQTVPLLDQPTAFVIGGVGHRVLPNDRVALQKRIRETLHAILETRGHGRQSVELVISVAEGADRLIIEAARAEGIPYRCVLPCAPGAFEDDFSGPESIAEFRRLLAGAANVVQPPQEPQTRVEGYLWASHYILERANLLLAVWDGAAGNGPAGTADSIEKAAGRSMPIVWVPIEPPHDPVRLPAAILDRR